MLRRHLLPKLSRALGESPVVAVLGARQVGKTTLVSQELGSGSRYHSFDDPAIGDLARQDPAGFVRSAPGRLILDEVQKVPELFGAIKMAVDRDRRPGSFLLLGSANFLLMRQISETLAGRIALLELDGLSWAERHGRGPSRLLANALDAQSTRELSLPAELGSSDEDLHAATERGGLPPAALDADAGRRDRWLDNYVRTYLERDLRDLAQVGSLPDFRRLMALAALRTAQVLNVSELARDAGISPTTARSYLGLLETSYLVRRLTPFAPNVTKRLTKAPKLHVRDTALAWNLTGISAGDARRAHPNAPAVAETYLVEQIAGQIDLLDAPCRLAYWRSHGGAEVDLVIERGERLLPIEIKAGSRLRKEQLQGMRSFLDDFGTRAPFGLIAYGGVQVVPVSERCVAVPWQLLVAAP